MSPHSILRTLPSFLIWITPARPCRRANHPRACGANGLVLLLDLGDTFGERMAKLLGRVRTVAGVFAVWLLLWRILRFGVGTSRLRRRWRWCSTGVGWTAARGRGCVVSALLFPLLCGAHG